MKPTSQVRFEVFVEYVFYIKGRGHIAGCIRKSKGNAEIGDFLRVEGTDFEVRIKGFDLIRSVKKEDENNLVIDLNFQGLEPAFQEGKGLVSSQGRVKL